MDWSNFSAQSVLHMTLLNNTYNPALHHIPGLWLDLTYLSTKTDTIGSLGIHRKRSSAASWVLKKELQDMMQGFNLGHVKKEETFDARQFRYASLLSQRDDLDIATIAKIEEAAVCCHLRDFQAALCIFDALPANVRQHPSIVYERSQVYWLDWSLYKCETVLEEGIAWGKDRTPDSAKPGIYTLLRIALGRVRALTRGNFTEGRDALREVKHWLLHVPVEDFTDVQVRALLLFLVEH